MIVVFDQTGQNFTIMDKDNGYTSQAAIMKPFAVSCPVEKGHDRSLHCH